MNLYFIQFAERLWFFVFSQILKIIHDLVDPFVLLIMIFIAIFEYFVDGIAFKKAGMDKDAKAATVISIVFLIGTLALFVITMF